MERILQVRSHGHVVYEQHLSEGDTLEVTESGGILTASVSVPSDVPTDAAGEGTPAPDAEPDLVASPDELTVEELKGLLRDKGLPVSGRKADLIARLNA